MYDRDTWYEYSVELDVDPETARSAGKYQVIAKAEEILEDELGDAAAWFEVAATDDNRVTFELRVGTAHTHDVGEADTRETADEWASEMFDRVDAPVAIDDLEYRGVTVPTDEGDVPIDEHCSTDEDPDPDDSDAATIGTDSPTDGSEGSPAAADPTDQEGDEAVTLEHAMGG